MVEPKVIYEDQDLIVIDKPAGMVVNRSETSAKETVQDWVEKQRWWHTTPELRSSPPNLGGEKEVVFIKRSGVAHRLDKETSGCLIIAKNPTALENLMAQFKNRQVHKEYLALVHGRLEPREGTIKLPIGRNRFERKKRQVLVEGKKAETDWVVQEYFDGYTLVLLGPKTGRTHQIRVHLAYLGHPIVADKLYLNKKLKRLDEKVATRHLLHAWKIRFSQPVSGEEIAVGTDDPKFGKLIR